MASAISAVDIALWDLRAKLLGLSLADAIGRAHDARPVYGSGGFTSQSEAELTAELTGWVEQGIGAVKMKVGREPTRDEHRVSVARQAIGDDVALFVDANGAVLAEAGPRNGRAVRGARRVVVRGTGQLR